MDFRKVGSTYILRLDRGEEILSSVKDFCVQNSITAAEVSGIGGVENPTMGCYDLTKQAYNKKTFNGIFEITTLAGNITVVDEKPFAHLHITIADKDLSVKGGHLLEGKIGLTGEIFIKNLDTKITRKHVDALGLNIFDL